MNDPYVIWDTFCQAHGIGAQGVPLFETVDEIITTTPYGRDQRHILKRSAAMDSMIIREATTVIEDFQAGTTVYDGLIYMMFWKDQERVLPLYIGKAEKYGRNGGNLSANIAAITRNHQKFARWGSNYSYHIGDLSAVVCSGHPPEKQTSKYRRWATQIFQPEPHSGLRLKRDTFFWMQAWKRGMVGIWEDYGPTSLTFLEYLLIGVASDRFPGILLNNEGVNRSAGTGDIG
jgi:hypothetical protein